MRPNVFLADCSRYLSEIKNTSANKIAPKITFDNQFNSLSFVPKLAYIFLFSACICMCRVACMKFKLRISVRSDDNPTSPKKPKHTLERRASMGCINTTTLDTLTRSQWANVTSLDSLLRDPVLLEKFKQFATKEHSADLLYFWLEVDTYPFKQQTQTNHGPCYYIFYPP